MATRIAYEILNRIVRVEKTEVTATLWSFSYFFCMLCGFYILRPIRDEMGIQAGIDQLHWLFTGTFVTMLAIVPIFGWLTSRFPRRQFMPAVYFFFAANLLVFFAVFSSEVAPLNTARAFFIWLNVFNLFVVSVFWSFMADLYSNAQARRLYGFIAAGGYTGAIAGPIITTKAAPLIGPALLLPISACFLLAAAFCILRLSAWSRQQPAKDNPTADSAESSANANDSTASDGPASDSRASNVEQPIGGSIVGGISLFLKSDYLLGIGLYVILFSLLSTFLYFQQANIVSEAISDPDQRIALFALIDLVVNSITLIVQLLVVNRIIGKFGLTVTLMLLPIVAAIGFFVMGLFPTLAVLIVFGCIRRAGEYAISRPAREILFTVISREEKYKAKNLIDTVAERGGRAMSGWLVDGLRMLGLGLSGISFVAVPVAILWATTAYLLGRRQEQLRAALSAKRTYSLSDPGSKTPTDSENRRRTGPAADKQPDPD